MSQHIAAASLLMDIEACLRQLNLWQNTRPSDEALAGVEPFCIDTLDFPQWLQFVFLEKMAKLIQQQSSLPERCHIAPIAAEYFKGLAIRSTNLLTAITQLDRLLNE